MKSVSIRINPRLRQAILQQLPDFNQVEIPVVPLTIDDSTCGIYASRSNEFYNDMSALYVGERQFVRRALHHSNKILMINEPGKRPLIVCAGITPHVSMGNANNRTTFIDLASEQRDNAVTQLTFEFSQEQIYRVTVPADLASQLRDQITRVSRIPGATEADVEAHEAQRLQSLDKRVMVYPLSQILTSAQPQKQCTLKYQYDTADGPIFQAASLLREKFGAHVYVSARGTMRVAFDHPTDPQLLNTVFQAMASFATDVIPDVRPVRTANAKPAPRLTTKKRITMHRLKATMPITKAIISAIADKLGVSVLKASAESALLTCNQADLQRLHLPICIGDAFSLQLCPDEE